FSRFLGVGVEWGVVIGMVVVLFYSTLGGMKGITYTQVAQYCVLIFAFMVPAFFISFQMTGHFIPQIGMGATTEDGMYILKKLDNLLVDLGFTEYTKGNKSTIDVFAITAALMLGTAGLPHVIVRFFTVPKVSDARKSGLYALIFIGILYTTAPAISVFARTNLINTTQDKPYAEMPSWFKTWENTGLLGWFDKNNDGKIQSAKGEAISGSKPIFAEETGKHGERVLTNINHDNANELYVNGDIMVLANPEIADLPAWVIGLVAAGGLAAALSTAAGLLIVISSAISHDLIKKTINPNLSEKGELRAARIASVVAVCIAGYFGINPPGFVASVVAIAFGYAAATFFPAIFMGIFSKRMNKEGVIAGMVVGLLFTMFYVLKFKLSGIAGFTWVEPILGSNKQEDWWWGISPEGIGFIAMILNFVVSIVISYLTPPVPKDVQEMVENIRIPSGAGAATHH
ncbi:MAG: sodium:solute symporter family protein, partial [Cruoricaptor ignavus]|nr:sodium:solute symporter family protein [Cruoricaptor ignavus]